MEGWANLGAAFGGDSEKSYQEGLALGAKTEDALAAARERVEKNAARARMAQELRATGLDENTANAASTALTAGASLTDPIQLMLKNQEFGFRAKAGDPNVSLDEGNRALLGVASGPVEPIYKVGNRAFNKFDTPENIEDLGAVFGSEHAPADRVQWAEYLAGLTPEERNQRLVWDKNFQQVREVNQVPTLVTRTDSGAPAQAPLSTLPDTSGAAAEIERSKAVGRGTGEAQMGLPQALARFNNQTAQTDLVMSEIDKALADNSVLTTGPIGKATGWIPGTPAADFQNRINTIKANVGFQQLQQMRYESPTGGALGQVAVQELQFLQAALGSLDTAQSPAQMAEMLQQVRQRYDSFKKAAAADYAAAQAKAGAVPGAPGAAPPATPQGGEAKVLGGKKYVKINGQWFEDDGT